MLEEEKVTEAFELFEAAFIRGEGGIQSILRLRSLLAQASEPQRVWITREIDNEAQEAAVRTAMSLIAAVIEIADPLRELVMLRYRAWTVFDAAREGFAMPNAKLADVPAIDALPAPTPRKPAKHRRAPRRKPGRSNDGKRPWAHRLEPPGHSN